MSGHTPGPWSVPHFVRPDANCQCSYVLVDGHLGAVCTVHASGSGDDWQSHGDNPKFEEAVANARLIAAAPDLLEALESMLAHCIGQFACGETGRNARAAILKARRTTDGEEG